MADATPEAPSGGPKIGLLADTHDRLPAIAELLRRFRAAGCTHVLHAGDYCAPFALAPFRDAGLPLLGVYGRNDGDREGLRAAAEALPAGGALYDAPHACELHGTSVLLVHELADASARSLDAYAVVVHGCSHRADVREPAAAGRPLIVNPGEACGWLHGVPTAAILDLGARTVERVTLDDPVWTR